MTHLHFLNQRRLEGWKKRENWEYFEKLLNPYSDLSTSSLFNKRATNFVIDGSFLKGHWITLVIGTILGNI